MDLLFFQVSAMVWLVYQMPSGVSRSESIWGQSRQLAPGLIVCKGQQPYEMRNPLLGQLLFFLWRHVP